MTPLRVVQVGTGPMVHAAHLMHALYRLPDFYEVLGIVEEDARDRENAQKNPAYAGIPFISWEEALALRPEAIMVETSEHRLVENAIRALEAGFPVHMDKPGSEDSVSFHRMCDLAREKNLVLSLGYMYRENPAVQYGHLLKDEGKLGEILSVEAQMSVAGDREYRETLCRFKGGMLYYLGCHMIDLIVGFCGFPEEVIPLNSKSMIDGVDCVDNGMAAFRYPNGVSFAKATATEINGVYRRSLVVSGTKGTYEIRPMEDAVPYQKDHWNEVYAWETLNNEDPWKDGRRKVLLPATRRYDGLLLHFYEYVRGTKKNPYTPEFEAELHDLILRACEVPVNGR